MLALIFCVDDTSHSSVNNTELTQNGFYVEPSPREGIWMAPVRLLFNDSVRIWYFIYLCKAKSNSVNKYWV